MRLKHQQRKFSKKKKKKKGSKGNKIISRSALVLFLYLVKYVLGSIKKNILNT